MKNKTKILALSILAAAGGLVACTTASNVNNNVTNDSGAIADITTGTADVHELYAFEAATTIGQLASLDVGVSSLARNPLLSVVTSSTQTTTDTTADLIETYLPSVEGALLGSQSLLSMETQVSDNAAYVTKIVVTYTDTTLAGESFTMYFNETVKVDYDDDDDDWDDKNEVEEESYIEGIVIQGENTYTIRGEKEIENDESEVNFWLQLDANTYVQVEQEKENDEQEFSYEVYQNRSKVYEYSLEVERNQVELKVVDKAALSALKMEFDLYTNNGVSYIRAKVTEKGTTRVITYQKVTDAAGNSYWEVVTL